MLIRRCSSKENTFVFSHNETNNYPICILSEAYNIHSSVKQKTDSTMEDTKAVLKKSVLMLIFDFFERTALLSQISALRGAKQMIILKSNIWWYTSSGTIYPTKDLLDFLGWFSQHEWKLSCLKTALSYILDYFCSSTSFKLVTCL